MLEKQQVQSFSNERSLQTIKTLLWIFKKRKSTRHFSSASIEIEIIKNAIAIAGTSPSGANKQPWSFAIINDPTTKSLVRQWAEEEEKAFYERGSKKWLKDLKPLHTNATKEFLTEASYLIPIFYTPFEVDGKGQRSSNYYTKESVGIATGFLISALHLAGLSVLTYTPSKRKLLTKILNRPECENTFMILATGLPAESACIPQISKKSLEEILTVYRNVNERSKKPIIGEKP